MEKAFQGKGVYPAIVTPFTSEKKIDHLALEKYLSWILDKKVHGLFVGGTGGEGLIMRPADREDLLRAVVELVDHHIPVVAHIGDVNASTTLHLAQYAEKIGVEAIAAVTPFFYHPDDHALVNYFKKIAEVVSIPFFLYNLPSYTTVTFPPDQLKEFAKYPHFGGMKETSFSIYLLMEYMRKMPEQGVVIAGVNRLFLPALAVGSPVVVNTVSCAFPEVYTSMYHAFTNNRMAEAQELQMKVVDITEILAKFPEIAPLKTILQWRGIPVKEMMPPLRELTKEEETQLKQKLLPLQVLPELNEG